MKIHLVLVFKIKLLLMKVLTKIKVMMSQLILIHNKTLVKALCRMIKRIKGLKNLFLYKILIKQEVQNLKMNSCKMMRKSFQKKKRSTNIKFRSVLINL